MTSKAAKLDHKDLASSPRRPETMEDALAVLGKISENAADKELTKAAAEAAEMLELYLSLLSDFEKDYASAPDKLTQCLTNLENDQDAITECLDKLDDKGQDDLADAVEDLLLTVENRPVLTWSLQFLRRYCKIPSMIAPEEDDKPMELKYKTQNLLWDAEDKKRLLKNLGFIFHSSNGSSHDNWIDTVTGKKLSICNNSENVASKDIIKEILKAGITLERIKAAFDKQGIPFKIIKP